MMGGGGPSFQRWRQDRRSRPWDVPDFRWVRHPIRWIRWQANVHRQGPYAPDFAEWLAARKVHRWDRPSNTPWSEEYGNRGSQIAEQNIPSRSQAWP
jgi:hypothetical protein